MHYLAELLQRQHAEARDEVEAKERASTLNDDATFFSPNWANYTQHSVVPLHDAVCLAAGIKHDHALFRYGWGFRMEPHATGGAKQALRNFVEWHKLAFHCATVRSGGLETTARSESNHQVSLRMFAEWAKANAIPLPPQFPRNTADTQTESVSSATWQLKPRPVKTPCYRNELYMCLKKFHDEGRPRPKARDVLDYWRENPQPNLEVMTDGVKYGANKEAGIKAINQAIKNLCVKVESAA
jgi:hypothetical protein